MNTQKQTILLAGASGVFGRAATAALTGAGHTVVALGRGAANDVRADLLDRDGLLRAVAGRHADVVIHAATALAKPPLRHGDMAMTDRLRTVGTRNLVEAALAVGATRFIAESMIFGYGYAKDLGPVPLTEDGGAWAPHQADPAFEEHVAAMRTKEQLTFGTPGLAGVSLRYGLFYGPGATETVLAMLRRRQLPLPGDGGRVLPWVHLDDAASAMVAAVERGLAGHAYNIADDTPMGFREALVTTAEVFGVPKPLWVPRFVVRATPYVYAALSSSIRVDTSRAAAELGWRAAYRSMREGLAADAAGR